MCCLWGMVKCAWQCVHVCIDVCALFGLVRCACNQKCCPVFTSEIEYLGMHNHKIFQYIHLYVKYYVRKKNTEEDFKRIMVVDEQFF